MRYWVYVLLLPLMLDATMTFAGDRTVYGKKISVKETTPIREILADPEKYSGKRVLVEGKVGDVCKKMGCWMMLTGEGEGETVRVKV